MTRYPDGYGTTDVTFDRMVAKHGERMHPEFARRLFAYLEAQGGRMGIGGGWRSTQPNKPGFAPDGKSFHQDQRFRSGFVGYAAVDLVCRVPGQRHRAPFWSETADAPEWGLHTFIHTPPEPWHMQCISMRGWQSWVNQGRPDPQRFTIPGDKPPPIPPELIDMQLTDYYVVTFSTIRPGAFLVGPGGPVHIDAQMRDDYLRAGAKHVDSSNVEVLASYERVARGLAV